MSTISNILATFFKVLFTTLFVGWFLFFIGYSIVWILGIKRRIWFKYKILRKPYKEEDVAWCMSAMERGITEGKLKAHLVLKNTPIKRVEELGFIFRETEKQLKGGKKNGRFKTSDSKSQFSKGN